MEYQGYDAVIHTCTAPFQIKVVTKQTQHQAYISIKGDDDETTSEENF